MAKQEEMSTEKMGPKTGGVKNEIIKNLTETLEKKDKKLKELKKETRNLLTELDDAYKELRTTQEELVLKEKLNTAGTLAAGVAHEIRNRLSIIGMSIQYLHHKFLPGDAKQEFTQIIMDNVEKLNNVVSNLLCFAQPNMPKFQRRDVHKVLDRLLNFVKYKCIAQKIKVIKQYSCNTLYAEVDEELIEQAFLNLIDNAFWAMPEGGELIITTSVSHNTEHIEIKVTDTGFGISKTDYSRIFDPFFTQKEKGTGLGLSIVHRIIQEHRGSIHVESELNRGTTFIIQLPTSRKKKRGKILKTEAGSITNSK